MDYINILTKAENFVTALFEKNVHETLLFHNIEHTRNVVARTKEISSQYDLTEKDKTILFTAAWFHDTGHLFVEPAMHEIKSIELMKRFFANEITDDTEDMVPAIEDCIMATRIPNNPKTILQQIMSDADTYHVGTKEFKDTNKRLKKEYVLRKIIASNANWNRKSLEFLESHRYYTPYCIGLLENGKLRNIEKLRAKTMKNDIENNLTDGSSLDKKLTKEEQKQKTSLLNRGIQTMLRLASENHLRLSELADGKANILISVNAIIISVILTVLLRRLEVDTYLIFPTIIFLLVSLATIVIAIMATRPKVTGGQFSKEDILNKKTNLLFFGNFHKANLQEYEWGMQEMMKDQDYLYSTMVKDIYFLGVVLGRKYKLLRLAYIIFMVGIIVSVLAFSLAVILNKGGSANSAAMPL